MSQKNKITEIVETLKEKYTEETFDAETISQFTSLIEQAIEEKTKENTEKIKIKYGRLIESYKTLQDKRYAKVTETSRKKLTKFKKQVSESLNAYCNSALKQYLIENSQANISKFKVALAEDTIKATTNVLGAYSINTPSKYLDKALLESEKKLDSLNKQVTELTNSNKQLNESLNRQELEMYKERKIAELPIINKREVKKLLEGFEFNSKTEIDKKILMIEENLSTNKRQQTPRRGLGRDLMVESTTPRPRKSYDLIREQRLRYDDSIELNKSVEQNNDFDVDKYLP